MKCYLHCLGEEGVTGQEDASPLKYKTELFRTAYSVDLCTKSSPGLPVIETRVLVSTANGSVPARVCSPGSLRAGGWGSILLQQELSKGSFLNGLLFVQQVRESTRWSHPAPDTSAVVAEHEPSESPLTGALTKSPTRVLGLRSRER